MVIYDALPFREMICFAWQEGEAQIVGRAPALHRGIRTVPEQVSTKDGIYCAKRGARDG